MKFNQFGAKFLKIAAFCVFFIVWFQWILPVHAGYWADNATQPVPEGAKVTLELNRPDYFLGENVLVHFILENAGDKPFEASFGGDYRGASRHLRFTVTATDEAGQVAEDPDPSSMCMGGLGGPKVLEPGDKFITSLPLVRYCKIDKPGLYTIRATHDFGWKEGERKRPVGEVTITFHMPDAAEAEHIVSQMEKLPKDPGATWGQKTQDYQDFSCLRQPVYLKPLVRRARTGNKTAFQGLGCIETPEATEALIQLAGNSDSELALEAAQTLNWRLPLPELDNRFIVRRRLVERAWDDKFAPEVRVLATKFLARKETPEVRLGALMVESVGTKEQAPAVLDALEQALNSTSNPRNDRKDNILDLPQPTPELLRGIKAIESRGFSLGESVSGNARIFLYFERLANEPPPRPQRWPVMLDAFGKASQYPIRLAAIRSIPQPISHEYLDYIKSRLEDRDLGVCRAACILAGKSGDKRFLKPLLEIIATEHHEWLLREASKAAQTLGAGFALFEVWADRLADEHLYHTALDALQTMLELQTGTSSGRTDLSRAERLELRRAWKKFLSQHAEGIRNGKRFGFNDPAVTPELAGRARRWQLRDGTYWPVTAETSVSN